MAIKLTKILKEQIKGYGGKRDYNIEEEQPDQKKAYDMGHSFGYNIEYGLFDVETDNEDIVEFYTKHFPKEYAHGYKDGQEAAKYAKAESKHWARYG